VNWRFLWWVTVRLRCRHAGPLEVLFLAVVEDHVGQQCDKLGSLFRCERRRLRRGQGEFGQRRPAKTTWFGSALGRMTFVGRSALRRDGIGKIRPRAIASHVRF
jgi:hypothetical protein